MAVGVRIDARAGAKHSRSAKQRVDAADDTMPRERQRKDSYMRFRVLPLCRQALR